MPSLQALSRIPSFSSQLGQALGGGLTQGINSALSQMLEQKTQRTQGKALAEYLGQPELANQIGQLPIDIQKEIAKNAFKQKENQIEEQNTLQDAFNELSSLSNEVGYSPLSTQFHTTESAGKRAEFETLKAPFVAAIRKKLFPTGILTNQKMEYILNQVLPSHGDRKEVKLKKLKAIGEQLGLDVSSLEKEFKKPTKKEKISTDVVLMRDPNGILRRISKKDAIAAQKEGYKLEQ